ncbi:BatA and WFA domain-containing protein [Clostridium celatum]|uniref:vWA domain-containing protein n=1 Tax=Clostridium celatum TaxID=36834 RepID=UPI0029030370|nr:BatA and WFA domain-containing protein [Clostridium celatum]MDU2265363.1 BatA and WFA domain-containing protein [Clostridium celatum]MDU6294995.1 BatA and WFA domain-containing protein [Clostridium celatum]
MGFTNLWPLFLLLTIPPVIMLYILKRKYKEEVISSSLLWKEVYKNTRANTPWEKFKKNIMLLLQIIIILFIILALMKPFLNFGGKSYKNIIMVIDNSASMNTLYDDKSRLEQGKELAKEYLNGIKDGTNTYIISYDNTSNLLLNGDFNKDKARSIIDNIMPSYASGDISEVTSFVKAIGEGIGEEYEALIFTDKEISLQDINGKIIYLANSGLNGSIDNISHKFIEDKVKVIATVTNNGDSVYEGDFSLYEGDELSKVEAVNLQVGESITLSFELDNINSEYLKGELSRKDILAEDNTYYHVISENKINKVLLITKENVFLEKAFGAIENTEVYKTNDPSNITSTDDYDLYVFDNLMPESIPTKGSLLFINPSSNELFNVLKGGELGEATAVKGEVSTYLEGTQFTLSNYNIIETPYYGKNILTIDNDSIGFKGELNDRKIAALSFDLHNSDFALKKEFPILMYELGEDLISTGMVYSSNFKSGEKIVLKSSDYENEIKVVYPNGDIENLKAGEEVNSSKYLGVYKLNQNETKESFAVNFPSKSESNTSVQTIGENENIITSKGQLKSGINLRPLFILLAMIVVAIEWILYKKGN